MNQLWLFVRRAWIDLKILLSLWFPARNSGITHKERLENFYRPQAEHYDRTREANLHGRRPMLKAIAEKLAARNPARGSLVWVDLGGGTGENVQLMAKEMDLSVFKRIVVVDLCAPHCEIARRKVQSRGWTNVDVVEADATEFQPDEHLGSVSLVTWSYSLCMMPEFMDVVDKAASYLDPDFGVVGSTDFTVSLKHDLAARQVSHWRRWFWQIKFDISNVNIGPQRRLYLDRVFQKEYEMNALGDYPWLLGIRLKAPYYVWIGRARKRRGVS